MSAPHDTTTAGVDLGFRGVDVDNPGAEIIHRGSFKKLSNYWIFFERTGIERLSAAGVAVLTA